jgi:hypothetical protein
VRQEVSTAYCYSELAEKGTHAIKIKDNLNLLSL